MAKMFFKPFSLKCIGLLRFGAALLRLSHAWPFSARNAIRSRLCSPNTHSPRPFFDFFGEMLVFYCARAFLLSARALRPRISHQTLSAYACAVQTRLRPSNLGVFFKPFSLKYIGLLRLGSALLHPSHARPISTRKAIRSHLCGPNTLLLYLL